MSKPWDNEKTPITDMLTDDEDGFCCGIHDFQDIERRMRAAERLLGVAHNWFAEVQRLTGVSPSTCKWSQELQSHIEAAKKEDGR